jgi:molecular chaperone DnaK (HSP70)
VTDEITLGIDFGTSNTVAVLALGRRLQVVRFDGHLFMPSAVFLPDNGVLAVGRDAERPARLAPERFEPNPKRRIDDVDLLLGVQVVGVQDAIAAVLHRVLRTALGQLGGARPDRVNLTHPAHWGTSRRRLLAEAARRAGLGEVTMIPEPIAAATHYGSLSARSLPAGSSLAVYDLGGGTFDCAVVEATETG